MVKRCFKGKFDPDKLSAPDLAMVMLSLATLQQMDAQGLIEFSVGVSRESGKPKHERRFTMSRQRQRIVEVLSARDWTTVSEVVDLTGFRETSVGPCLFSL